MNSEELWQVDTGGQVYEASFEVLTQWVIEGAVLPTDKIRRGNLRWLEAGKVPRLQNIFKNGVPDFQPQIQSSITELPPSNETAIHNFSNETPNEQSSRETVFDEPFPETIDLQDSPKIEIGATENICINHNGEEAKFVCTSCGLKYCRDCPNSYGTVNVCPSCGELCELITKVVQKTQKATQDQAAYETGFGIGDFFNALAFPFKHRTSLILGGLMYGFFSIGQSALGFGSIYLAIGAMFSMMFANMLAFACLSNTIEEFTKGNLNTNFMPAFEDFNIWDDVVQPAILSFGVFLVSFGLLIAIVAGGVYFAFSSLKHQENPMMSLSPVSPKIAPEIAPAMNSFEELRKKDAEQKVKIAELMNSSGLPQSAANSKSMNSLAATDETEKSVEMADKLIKDMRKGQAESMLGPSPETQAAQKDEIFASLMKYGLIFFGLAFIGLFWAFFYYPAACLVAGYTKNIAAVLNPIIGLDTIKRLGFNYVKILGMQLVLSLMLFFVVGAIKTALSAFNMPTVGNVPATFISSFAYFYYYIVFGAILGYAVYKTKNLLDN